MGSLQSALVGFALCRLLRVRQFGPQENVILQTTAVAAATLPLAGGFVSIIPALEMLDPPVRLSTGQIFLWCTGISFFGVFFAVPLRRQVCVCGGCKRKEGAGGFLIGGKEDEMRMSAARSIHTSDGKGEKGGTNFYFI